MLIRLIVVNIHKKQINNTEKLSSLHFAEIDPSPRCQIFEE